MKIYEVVGVNYNKGTRKKYTVAPGCTMEYEDDAIDPIKGKKHDKQKNKPSADTELLEHNPDTTRPGVTVKITPMEEKDLSGWQTVSKKPTRYEGELAEREELAQEETKHKQNMVGQFYNKGGYGYMPDPDDFKTTK